MIYCPFCDCGVISKAKIIQTQDSIYICDECDLTWNSLDIRCENGVPLEIRMKKFGGEGLWSELTEIKEI